MSGWTFPVNPLVLTDETMRREVVETCRLRADEAPNGQRIPRAEQRVRWCRDDAPHPLVLHILRRERPVRRETVWVAPNGEFCHRTVLARSIFADEERRRYHLRVARHTALMWGFTGRLSLRRFAPTGPPMADLIEVRIYPTREDLNP